MPIQWAAKAAGEVVRRDWVIPVAADDNVVSFSASAVGVTIDLEERTEEGATFTLSAGTEGGTAIVTLTATTARGETLNETAYLPIRATPNAFSYTIAQVLSFALRPIIGLGGAASAAEQQDAREQLDDMLASWAQQGADLHVKLPTAEADILYVPDYAISAIKASLRVRLCGLYGKPVDMEDFKASQRGLAQIKYALLSDTRENEYF